MRSGRGERFKRQYVYRCPMCAAEVQPPHAPAWTVIDWSIPAPRIRDRRKFARRAAIVDTAFPGDDRAASIADPLMTQTTRQTLALLQPFLASQHDGRQAVRETWRELPCITTMNNEHSLIIPPFLAVMKNSYSPDGKYTLPPLGMEDPLTTVVASGSQHALVVPPWLLAFHETGEHVALTNPLRTIIAEGGSQHALIIPSFLSSYYGTINNAVLNDAMPTVTATDRHALIVPPLLVSTNYFDDRCIPLSDVLPTQTTASKLALLVSAKPFDDLDVEAVLPECGFRMLEPQELKLGMSFPDDYIILGSKRDQVRQIGNAVACNVAEWIVARCVESLS